MGDSRDQIRVSSILNQEYNQLTFLFQNVSILPTDIPENQFLSDEKFLEKNSHSRYATGHGS